MSEFNLNALIESVRESTGPNADDIAAKVQPLIPESERSAVELFLLTRYVANTRPGLARRLAHPQQSPPPSRTTRTQRSAKVAALQAHARFLRAEIVTESGEKWLADCSYDDLMFAAALRRKHAADTISAAEAHEALAKLVRKHRVARVGDLPAAVLDEYVASRQRAAA